jgi:hypothetical protein
LAAILSSVGMSIGPPKAWEAPNPMSSISTITTFGAPSGALTSKRAGALASRASSSLYVGTAGSWIGRTVRSSAPLPAAPDEGLPSAQDAARDASAEQTATRQA